MDKIEEFVNVSLRIRPALSQDSTESSCLQVISKQPPVLFVLDRSQTYHFDHIFTEDEDQETVFNETVKPLVEYVKQGYSCTVFAYGQTGTGKTYTVGTSSQVGNIRDAGLIPRAIEQFFECTDEDIEIEISVSFIEIYNEKVFDLLQNNNKPPLTVKGFRVQGVSQQKVFNNCEAKHLLDMGNKNRHTAETKQNSNSSRSHAVFTIHCNVRHKDNETIAKLNLVDLAGSESVRKTGNQGSTFQEGININKGLLCIGQVMTALAANSNFVPYRQSIITTILQDSLNRKNLVSLIACVNGNPEDCIETIQTLEFAQRVKKMKNKPEINEIITQYKKENPALFQPVKTGNTPFKRPAASQFQTPCLTKRFKTAPLRVINEPLGHSSATESPKSLSSISVSSISSNIEAVHQNLSPVIKKYMTAMESSLINRIEVLIKDTLKRPTRSSLLLKEKEQREKENTPSMSWNKIQNELSKMVRSEFAQLTDRAARATSSPLDESASAIDKIRRVLKYDSPILPDTPNEENNEHKNNKSKETTKDDMIFKVPDLPVAKKKDLNNKRIPSISLIEFLPRRSTRLSLKRLLNNNNNSEDTMDSAIATSFGCGDDKMCLSYENDVSQSNFDESCGYGKKRRSIRLIMKRNHMNESEKESVNPNDENSLSDFDLDATETIKEKYNKNQKAKQNKSKLHVTQTVSKKRRVTTTKKADPQNKVTNCMNEAYMKLTVKGTPAGKRILNKHASEDSPATAHTKHVLMLLNSGNARQLEELHSVGPKTAQKVLLFRELKGPLNKISDLSLMPGWHGKKFKVFVEQNFIKQNLL